MLYLYCEWINSILKHEPVLSRSCYIYIVNESIQFWIMNQYWAVHVIFILWMNQFNFESWTSTEPFMLYLYCEWINSILNHEPVLSRSCYIYIVNESIQFWIMNQYWAVHVIFILWMNQFNFESWTSTEPFMLYLYCEWINSILNHEPVLSRSCYIYIVNESIQFWIMNQYWAVHVIFILWMNQFNFESPKQ